LEDNPGNSAGRQTGWYVASTLEKLNPQQLQINYNKTLTADINQNFKLGFSVNTGLSFDLQRYTYSKFTFTLRQTTAITNFLDLTMSTNSENNEIFKYFYDHSSSTGNQDLAKRSPVDDLLNSFRFDNETLRKKSGFKLKSFNLDLVHHLGDWDATLGIKLFPELDQAKKQYHFNTTVSFLMQWKPVKELKTNIISDKDGFRYE
jgi:hypothetical protein